MVALLAIPGRRIIGWLLIFAAAAAYYQGYDARNVTTIPKSAATVAADNSSEVQSQEEREAVVSGIIVSPVKVDGDKASFALKVRLIGIEGAEPINVEDTIQVSIRLLQQEEQGRAISMGRGDPVEMTGLLKQPDTPRNFGGFDYRLYLYRNHIHWLFSVKGLDSVLLEDGLEHAKQLSPGDSGEEAAVERGRLMGWMNSTQLFRWNDDLRNYLGGIFDQLFPNNAVDSGYLKSLVLGLTDDMDPDLYQQFSQLGLTHILAISGLHVAVFVAGCMWLLRLFRLTREKMLTVTMVLVPFYVAISGGSPSAVRAGIMAMAGLYLARRRIWKDALNVIGLAAVSMLLWNPYFLYNVSFQLSFLVTLGLIVGVPRVSELLTIKYAPLNSLLSVTIVAQLVSFPITVYYFNGVSLLSAFANLLLVPFISFAILPLGTFALIAGLMSVNVGSWIGWLVSKLNAATFWFIDAAATHDPFRLIWPKPSLLWVALYYVLLGAACVGAFKWKDEGRPVFAYVSVAALILLLWYGYNPQLFDRSGNIHFIDVGQGDAILVRTPQGKHMLVDGGGTISFRKPGEEWKERSDPYEVGKKLLVPLLKQRGVQRIDVLVVSHQDADHIGGLQAVVEQIPVRTVLMNGTWKGNETSRKLFETAIGKGAKIVTAADGRHFPLDRYTQISILTAQQGKAPMRLAEEQNGESVVLLMQMRDVRFLFTGDMRSADEASLIASRSTDHSMASDGAAGGSGGRIVPLDVLKIAHHGSKTSTSEEWLAYWQPKMSVISVGLKNSYGHPNPGVMERLERSGTEILRTDRDGEVVFTVTEKGMNIDKMR